MTDYNIIAIDPGASGGIAGKSIDGEATVHPMPNTLRDIVELFAELADHFSPYSCLFIIEDTGSYMPGNSGPAAVKFARHCGALDGIISVTRQPVAKVRAAKWEHWYIGKPNYEKIPATIQGKDRSRILTKRKQERKNKIKAKAQEQFPHLKVTLKTSDALGILSYACANLNELFPTIGGQHVRSDDQA